MKSTITHSPANIFIFCALACEAKPLIAHFGLKKLPPPNVFDIYQHESIVLSITGVGKANMAAGVAYTLATVKAPTHPILINIGIAGHRSAALGSLFAAEKISDFDSARHYFPQLLPHGLCATLPLETVSQPRQDYAPDILYDMEASAFYEIAVRFTTSELILTLKVVSDNQDAGITQINAVLVSAWITAHFDTVERLLVLLDKRVQHVQEGESEHFEQLIRQHHFTVSEKVQLKALLLRWELLSERRELPVTLSEFKNTRAFLEALSTQLARLPVVL